MNLQDNDPLRTVLRHSPLGLDASVFVVQRNGSGGARRITWRATLFARNEAHARGDVRPTLPPVAGVIIISPTAYRSGGHCTGCGPHTGFANVLSVLFIERPLNDLCKRALQRAGRISVV